MDTEQRDKLQKWLKLVRTQLIDRFSEVTVNQILDRLYEKDKIKDEEMDVVRAQIGAANKARKLIEFVKNKGPDAISVLKTALREVDPCLSDSIEEPEPSVTKNVEPQSKWREEDGNLQTTTRPRAMAETSQRGQQCPAPQPQVEKKWSSTLVNTTDTFWNDNVKNPDNYPTNEKAIKSRVALLITNIEFSNKKLNREGADKDEENMDRLLSGLGYEVVKHRNLTAKGIDDALSKFSRHPKLKDTDSVLVVIMSHGKRDAVFGVNHGETSTDEFLIDNIYEHLGPKKCRALLNKPKIIIIQACRGGKKGSVKVGVDADQTLASDSGPLPGAQGNMERYVHVEKDFISLLSSTPGTVSYRHRDHGSFLIQYIVDVFNTLACKEHVLELFRGVLGRFEKLELGDERQMPNIDRYSQQKDFYFYPGASTFF